MCNQVNEYCAKFVSIVTKLMSLILNVVYSHHVVVVLEYNLDKIIIFGP